MVEVKTHPHTGNAGILQGMVVIGVFATAFYFIFLRGSKAMANAPLNDKGSNNGGTPNIDMSAYANRTKFCSDIPDDCIQGYDMPPSLNDLDWSNGGISVISKPTAPNLFQKKVAPRHLFTMLKVEDTITGNEEVIGYKIRGNLFVEEYENAREHLALVKNTDFKK